MSPTRRLAAVLIVILGLAVATASAQTFRGGISGRIADATGAVLPGVSVTVTNDATAVSRTSSTGVVTMPAGWPPHWPRTARPSTTTSC